MEGGKNGYVCCCCCFDSIYKGMGLGGGRTGVVAAPGGKASRDGAAADKGGGAGSAT